MLQPFADLRTTQSSRHVSVGCTASESDVPSRLSRAEAGQVTRFNRVIVLDCYRGPCRAHHPGNNFGYGGRSEIQQKAGELIRGWIVQDKPG